MRDWGRASDPVRCLMPSQPAGDRSDRTVWLGPLALGLGLLCWLAPIAGEAVAAAAIASGAGSIATRREYRIDWTAVAGICAGALQLYLALMVFVMTASGT